jgi:hypothetical protein
VEELVHVHLRVPLRGPILLLQLYGRLQQGLGSVGPGLFDAVGSETQKISQLHIRFLSDPKLLSESGSGHRSEMNLKYNYRYSENLVKFLNKYDQFKNKFFLSKNIP